MKIIKSTVSLRKELNRQREENLSIGLVPTMGNIHEGHLKLVEAAAKSCDYIVATIFVNPLQFGPNEDLQCYPRTMEEDSEKLKKTGCHCLFAPSEKELFGMNLTSQTTVHIPLLSEKYCGQTRPGHFDGVATVVCKIFNIVNPDIAFFGLKDYQQFLIIQKLVKDLGFPLKVVGIEVVRDQNGLALSSRNNFLSAEQLKIATNVNRCLTNAKNNIMAGLKEFRSIEQQSLEKMYSAGLKPEYFSICHAYSLEPAEKNDLELVILTAVYLGSIRLIDNVRISLN
ncbi:MAG: pantoate--beta-alanine ligase [Gammaproteobacteria bacterium]|nr:pantoate--beta-alanine ligase [Gammaproteobacteria bacterium]